MSIKDGLKKNPITEGSYKTLKRIRDNRRLHARFAYHGVFEDRSKKREKLCIILAGYKEFIYDSVFGRITAFITEDIDVCVISSGTYSEKLHILCEKNMWSYLSTKENDVSLVQNVAINLHPAANYIYKLDEDIFITKGFFDNMISAYESALDSDYIPGVIAPLLLVNGFTTPRIINKLDMKDEFEKRFGKLMYAAGPDRNIENNAEVAKFMWGEGGKVLQLDELNELFGNKPKELTACPIRFSIGAIMFPRFTWEHMNYFDVEHNDKEMMGKDEVKLCRYCCINSRPIMISENIVVGHFSFGPQIQGMIEFYKEHPERFALKE